MEYKGRKIGFKRTVGSVAELSKLAPGGQIERLGEVFSTENLLLTVENGSKVLAILNKWYEKSLAFEDPGYTPDPIPADWFLLLEMDEYTALINEAMERFNEDDKPTVEAVEPKGKKNTLEVVTK